MAEKAQLIALKTKMQERNAYEYDHSHVMRGQLSEIC
jgi:hypothetical protein